MTQRDHHRKPGQCRRRAALVAAAPRLTLCLAAALALLPPASAAAQITRDPTGVNVNASAATSVFITFGNLGGLIPVEAFWCGELIDAFPDRGMRCDPATLFGSLPLRLNQARRSGIDGLTDIMTIPPSVARRAYQAAQAGADSRFYYVRRFIDPAGGPDEYVFVTCRLTDGGARVPFSLLDVAVAFAEDEPVLSVRAGEAPPPLSARIAYNGSARLSGRWEVVHPGDDPPAAFDLLSEATLPAELRGTQRRYREVGRFDVFLPPVGEVVLPGPDPALLPTAVAGMYLVLLRIEATPDREGDSNLGAARTGTGVVHSGGVAGFALPPLRYFVGDRGVPRTAGLLLLRPQESEVLPANSELVFNWTAAAGAAAQRLEVQHGDGSTAFAALLRPGTNVYRAPSVVSTKLGAGEFRWRVVALAASGRELAATPWRQSYIGAPPPESGSELRR